jgi:hypothetical protein
LNIVIELAVSVEVRCVYKLLQITPLEGRAAKILFWRFVKVPDEGKCLEPQTSQFSSVQNSL